VADAVKFGLLRKILRTIGLSEAAVNDLLDWIIDRLASEQQEAAGTEAVPTFPYRIRDDFLSPAERNFYQVLKGVVGTSMLICPKVSLSDLFYVKSSDPSEYRVYTNKIDRKHVDFVLCDPQTVIPLAGIELDDKSHERADRKKRDEFVEDVFGAAGLELLRVRVQRSYQPQELAALLEPILASLAASPASIPAPLVAATAETAPAPPATSKQVVNSLVSSGTPCCPKCDSEMILRTAKSGTNQGQQFWGCSNFPRCRAMLQLDAVAV
jgi:very-short-patch-repair endonuclease